MRFDRLMWGAAALFLIFGLLLLAAEDRGNQRWLVALTTFWLGCFALAMAADGVAQSRIRLQTSVIHRNSRPRLFWAAVGLVAAAGAGTIVTSFWAFFFKTW
jgi:hypothetical protein